MLQFETLLLRQLQRQQNRDEFCDTVLHSQGVSVPVHSCVLSAFSPRFYGTLSSMPVPMAGQRRLIELQAVDACTLLGLVNLLYSGQFHDNREQVLSAAQTLGFELPQWEEDDDDADQEVDTRERGERVTRRMGKGSRGEKEKRRESGTQTECWKKTDERDAQTDLATHQTMYVIDPSTFTPNQELGSCVDIQDTAVTLQATHLETCAPSAMTPGIRDGRPVSEVSCLSQIYLYSLETSHHQTSTSLSLQPQNSVLDQTMFVPAAENDLKQFEGNIPGFINYFLDSTNAPSIGRRGQGCAREGTKEVVTSTRARSSTRESGREWVRWTGGGRGGRRQRHMERCGLVAILQRQGQGGGKVGRLLGTRSTGKNRMKAFQRLQVTEALVESRGTRGRGRLRQRGKTGRVARSEKPNDPPCKRRSRGHPRIHPLAPASRGLSTIAPKQSTVDPTELDLLHTTNPVPINQTEPIQPIDTLLEDIMTGLHFLPPAENPTNQPGIMSTTTSSGPPISKAPDPSSHFVRPTDPKQHMEGDIGDILDHFLRTFEQQVAGCGFDVGDETSQGSYKPDSRAELCSNTSKTFAQLQPHNPQLNNQTLQANHLHTSSTLSAQPQPMADPSLADLNKASDGQNHESKVKRRHRDSGLRSPVIVQEFEHRRLTRSQTTKRKLQSALINPQLPLKRKCKENQSDDPKKKRQRAVRRRPKSKACMNEGGVNKRDKSSKSRTAHVGSKESQKQARASERPREDTSGKNKRSVDNRSRKMDGFNNRKNSPPKKRRGRHGCGETKKNVRRACVEAERKSSGLKAGRSSGRRQIDRPRIASSSMEKVNMLLQLQDDKEDKGTRENVGTRWEKNVGNRRLVSRQCPAEERFAVENSLEEMKPKDDGGIKVNGKVKGPERLSCLAGLRPRPKDERRVADTLRQKKMTEAEERQSPLKLNLPSNTEGIKDSALPSVQSEAKLAATQSYMHRKTEWALYVDNAPLAYQERLSPHRPPEDSQQLSESSVDKEEDVDVVEVSSQTTEPPAVSVLEVDLSTEEEVEEDFEIDVLGLEPD